MASRKASVSFSGTGTVSINGQTVVVDEVYAGLFPLEWRAPVALRKGWNLRQAKSLSHWGAGDEWGFRADLMGPGGTEPLTGATVDPCAKGGPASLGC